MNERTDQAPDEVEAIVQAVLRSAKYKRVCPDLIRRIGARELTVRRSFRKAVKSTKRKLHQVGGAYFETTVDYDQGLGLLREAARSGEPGELRQACRELMRLHASTRERLEILDEFYAVTLAELPPVRTVIDLACGFNPLAWPWMPFDAGTEYYACDIYADMIDLIQGFMEIVGIKGDAEVRDIINDPPTRPADLALILKTLPCLAQLDKSAVPRLLDTLQARYLLISFPGHSLGGRRKGMVENYENQFGAWISGRNWEFKRVEFPSELVFLVIT